MDQPLPAPMKTTTVIINYRFTEAAALLLSLTSGISPADIKNIDIQNAQGSGFPSYDSNDGGGGITFPGDDKSHFRMNLTSNFFDGNKSPTNYSNSPIDWFDITSHEVGHVRDIKEIAGGKLKYFATFIAGYIVAAGHNGNPREKRADIGQVEFGRFQNFLTKYYGVDKLKNLFNNSHTTDNGRVKMIQKWWDRYQKQKLEAAKLAAKTKGKG